MIVTNKIKMDLLSKQNVQTIYAVRDDTNSRLVQISLFEGGVPWEVPSDAKIAIGYRSSNGANGVYDTLPNGESASMFDGNQITILLVPAALYPGTTKVTVVISDENYNQISTFPLNVEVDENYSYDASEPETYINLRQWIAEALSEEVSRVIGVVRYDGEQNLTEEQKEQARENVGAASNAEVENIRKGFDGTEYETAGEAVRNQIEQLNAKIGNSGGGLNSTASALLVTILKNAVFTSNQNANIVALEAALASGGGTGGGDDTPETTEEVLTRTFITESYPDITTFAYTPKVGANAAAVYATSVLFEPSTLGGGVLRVDFDATRISKFRFILYVFDADGNPYQMLDDAATRTDGVYIDPPMVSAGTSPGWSSTTESFEFPIPDGCNVMLHVSPNGTILDSSLANNYAVVDAIMAGEIVTAKVVKEV